jgi:hypothetical protein
VNDRRKNQTPAHASMRPNAPRRPEAPQASGLPAIKNATPQTSHRSSNVIIPAPAVMRPPGVIRSLWQ